MASMGRWGAAVLLGAFLLADCPATRSAWLRPEDDAGFRQRVFDAEAVYRDDLTRNPENGWSLFGRARSLRAQGRTADVAAVEARFQKAWARADVTLSASRFYNKPRGRPS